MSRIHNSEALPYSLDERADLDYQADLWAVPWRKFGFSFCGVYLISPPSKWPIKIGISEDAATRLNQLQTAHWHQMRIVSYWICADKAKARKLESAAHLELKNRRMMGEWFDLKADAAVRTIEFSADILGIELAKKIPETEKYVPIKNYVDEFYQARARQLDKFGE